MAVNSTKAYRAIRRAITWFEEKGAAPDKVMISAELREKFGEDLATIGGLPLVVDESLEELGFAVSTTEPITVYPGDKPRGIQFTGKYARLNEENESSSG